MKSGASDPFADEDRPTEEGESTAESGPAEFEDGESASDETRSIDASEDVDEGAATSPDAVGDSDEQPTSNGASAGTDEPAQPTDEAVTRRDQLPFVLRRDKVKDERPEVHQLFVRQPTHDSAVDAERELENRLDADLSRTDAREAIYLAGMNHLDDAEAILREWGYDF